MVQKLEHLETDWIKEQNQITKEDVCFQWPLSINLYFLGICDAILKGSGHKEHQLVSHSSIQLNFSRNLVSSLHYEAEDSTEQLEEKAAYAALSEQ